ncbi:uncharacterized protein LOC135837780 [Planococcus citri]|uniref:uncharacterized protein LOC135837777 n=1 Tax=Planococcus citri TaxID=170843 RepID=UPI0031F91F70
MSLWKVFIFLITRLHFHLVVSKQHETYQNELDPDKPLYMDPTNDFVFKKIFANCTTLSLFINSALNSNDLTVCHLNNPPQQYQDDKQIYYDIHCKANDNSTIIVEMQFLTDKFFLQRSIYYTSHSIVSQLKTSGEKRFEKLSPVHLIAICDFKVFENGKSYITRHQITNIETHETSIPYLQFVFIELWKLKFNKIKYQKDASLVELFAYFFSFQIKNDEYKVGFNQMLNDNSVIKTAAECARMSAWTEDEKERYEIFSREQARIYGIAVAADEEGEKRGFEKGEKRGFEKGALEEQKKMIINMQQRNLSSDIIQDVTGLNATQIAALLN